MPAQRLQRRAQPSVAASLDLLSRLLAARGVDPSQGLKLQNGDLIPPISMRGLPEATMRLADAIEAQESVLVIGDYDADGATSTALLLLGLRAMGFGGADFLVPNRFEFGYGLTPEIVRVAAVRAPRPSLLITVDNGISSVEGVEEASRLGMDVLVTDHHLPGEVIPAAFAILNPNQPGCEFPSKYLAGVGVVFYLLCGLRAELRQRGWFVTRSLTEPRLAELLDLVALGTVADVVPLDANNRILVHQGLLQLRTGKGRPGVRALLQAAGREAARVTSADLGFYAGPRLNAAGRLQDMSLGIRCLIEEDPLKARAMAAELDALNRQRRQIEDGMQREALALLEEEIPGDEARWGLCLYRPEWHQGVVGLVASRLKERLNRPVIAFAPAADGELKGSARSIRGLHMRDVLAAIHAREPQLISRFGGHAMAAGLSLAAAHYPRFAEAFDEEVRRVLDPAALQGVLETDGELPAAEFTLPNAQLLREAAPWGQHFPEPLFDGVFRLLEQRIVGEKHLRISVSPETEPVLVLGGIVFNADTEIWPDPAVQRVRIAYRLDVNEYRGKRSLQLLVVHIERAD